ncbi:MAG: hypothetical protein RL748_253 [Pseudomonadota bacterium]|jgi:hypothetical protein
MADGQFRAMIGKLPFWLVVIIWMLVVGSIFIGLVYLFGGPAMERRQIKNERIDVLRTHYPSLSALFAQWDECNYRAVSPTATARICDHKMIKAALTIDKTADMLSFLQARDEIEANVDGTQESEE